MPAIADFQKILDELAEKAKQAAAEMMEVGVDDLELLGGMVQVKGAPGHGRSLQQIARALTGTPGFALPPSQANAIRDPSGENAGAVAIPGRLVNGTATGNRAGVVRFRTTKNTSAASEATVANMKPRSIHLPGRVATFSPAMTVRSPAGGDGNSLRIRRRRRR